MDYYNDDHDEDDLPVVSLPITPRIRRVSNDDTENDRSSKLLENWRSLYEISLHSLQSDEEDQRSITQKPFPLIRQTSITKPPEQRPYSPVFPSEIDSNTNQSKWEIRLPHLLHATVGPDRQKREITRRYTTDIVFQRSNSQNEYNPYSSPRISNGDIQINPIVKQLTQKFDRMTANNTSIRNYSSTPPKLHRTASLRSSGLNANTSERLIQRPRPMLPIRPSPDNTSEVSRSPSSGSVNKRMPATNGRTYRNKTGPPVSYSKHSYPPPSTTTVVKQLLGGGATLVYDSISSPQPKSSVPKHPRTIEEIAETLKSKNDNLTGRHFPPDSSNGGYATTGNKKPNRNQSNNPDDDVYERISHQTSIDLSESKSIPVPKEPLPRPTKSNENYYSVYDTAKWQNEN